ncbi:nuclear transport factor 2 family protein [Carboxylicivirga sp. M1479]|uniref:YybH family protein n=1 Tax=Carboxylicivirga sp. M1479 TaxID=2594476 RepID=UPI001177C087|nr:nuclear transport factor 2 family protein [Carboxylicivirga sp. M1479]TRX72383.1 nuclear transport factor 2 family protein [Carboxylicivirga sp. M1479]
MKPLLITLMIASLLFASDLFAQTAQMQKEVESTIESMIKCTQDSDLQKLMSFWHNGDDFTYIADGKTFSYEELQNLLNDYLLNKESIEVLKQTISVHALAQYKALCIWEGTEKVKMKDQEAVVMNWISTLVLENKKGGWVIIHGHTSHY